jgi:TM2 domain-containing membrane protein YozV
MQTRALKGTVLDYAMQTNTGVISADDGQRYLFVGAEWKAVGTLPDRGTRVDFLPQGGSAVAIYEAYGAPGSPQKPVGSRDCNRLAAGLLAIFLGCLGIHKFYLGYQKEGIILLLCGTVGWLLFIPGIAAAVIGLIEGIIYLCQTEEQFQRNYINGKKAWF